LQCIDRPPIYLQGLGRFREPRLPCEPPARLEELKQDLMLQQLETEVEQSRLLLTSYWKGLKRVALHEYQETWVRYRRDWQIITRRKVRANNPFRTDLVQSLSLLFPERLRLLHKLASDKVMTSKDRWLAMEDLYRLCTRDLSVLYLPGFLETMNRCLKWRYIG